MAECDEPVEGRLFPNYVSAGAIAFIVMDYDWLNGHDCRLLFVMMEGHRALSPSLPVSFLMLLLLHRYGTITNEVFDNPSGS